MEQCLRINKCKVSEHSLPLIWKWKCSGCYIFHHRQLTLLITLWRITASFSSSASVPLLIFWTRQQIRPVLLHSCTTFTCRPLGDVKVLWRWVSQRHHPITFRCLPSRSLQHATAGTSLPLTLTLTASSLDYPQELLHDVSNKGQDTKLQL